MRPVLALALVVDDARGPAQVVGGSLDHRAQVEEAVGDVHRQHAVGLACPCGMRLIGIGRLAPQARDLKQLPSFSNAT